MSQKDLLLNASTDVTVALRRTHGLLQSELSRSRFATETLNASTAVLHDLTTRYTAFDDIVSSSRELIIDLIRKNKSDRWYYETAIQLLIGILVWILVRRLLWGPVWLFFGLPFRLVWWALSLVASTVGVGSDGVAEIREGLEGIERAMGGAATVEVKGIPEKMLERMPTQSVVVEEPEITEESMKEKVERIIDGKEDVVVEEEAERNPKSRRVENDSIKETPVQEGDRNTKSRIIEYDSEETQPVQKEWAMRGEPVIHEEQTAQEGDEDSKLRMEYDSEEQTVQEEWLVQGELVQEGDGTPKPKGMGYVSEEEQPVQKEWAMRGEPVVHEKQTVQEGSTPDLKRMKYNSEGEQTVREKPVMQGEQVREVNRAPKPGRVSYSPAEGSSVLKEEPAVELTADTREAVEGTTHDEL